MIALLGLLALVVALALAVIAARSGSRDRRQMLDLVAAHGSSGVLGGGPAGADAAPQPGAATSVQSALLALAGRVAERGGIRARLSAKVERAGSSWTVEEWVLIWAGAVIGGAVVFVLLLGPIGLFLGPPLGFVGPHLGLSVLAARRAKQFGTDLPDALQLVASGLASGYSLPQALDAVVTLGEGPVSAEVGRALAQSRLGTSVEDALQTAADRVGSTDLAWVVMAIRIQRQVGGNLGEILLQVAGTVRERAWLRRHVAALSAEGKLSGYILGAMPLAIGGFLMVSSPGYIDPLISSALGLALLGTGVVMLAIGGLWMRAVVKIDL